MKSLIQYLFEALVNGPELEKNLKFEETDIEEILDILDSDEYNHFADLTGERYDKDTVRGGVFLLNNSTHFKIMYEGTLLGVFSVCLPENFKDLMNKREQSKYAENDFNSLETLFIPFLTAYLDGEPYDVIDKNIYKEFEDLENLKKLGEIKDGVLNNKRKYGNEISEYFKKRDELRQAYNKFHDPEIKRQITELNKKLDTKIEDEEKLEIYHSQLLKKYNDLFKIIIKRFVKRIMSKTGFVVIWQLSNKAKKKIDVNQVSLLKIFFQKLTELIKNTGAKYIIAQGKDEHVTKAYIKLGGFNSTEEFYNKHAKQVNHYQRDDLEFLEGTVIKQI